MPADSGKKINILYILNILKKYTDANHPMTQQQIADKLLSDYGMPANRATIKRNLADLMDVVKEIDCSTITRTHIDKNTGEQEEDTIYTDFYYIHDFSESELHMLIDGLLFSRSVPATPRKRLIEKLGNLSSSYFSQRMRNVTSVSQDSPQNPQLFYNIEVLDEAIEDGKQVEITYGYYGTDLKLHANMNDDGTLKKQLLNPYRLVATEGRYYLICNKDNYNNAANYRVDRIMSIKKLDTPSKPRSKVAGLENGLKLQEYIAQHVGMFSGELVKVEFIVPEERVSLVIDFFGKQVSFFNKNDGTVSCNIIASKEAMKHWATQFSKDVRVVSPESLVDEIREEIRKAADNYDMK